MTAKRSGHTKRKKLIAPEEPVIQKVDRFVYPREKREFRSPDSALHENPIIPSNHALVTLHRSYHT